MTSRKSMFLLSPHWKHHSSGGGSGGGRNKVAVVDHSVKEETSNVVIEEEEEEKLQAPMVRIGVLSRSRTVETVMVVPPSRVPSARVSDSSIETIRRSLREMEVQLVIAQDTVTAETRAEYDLRGETKEQQSAEAPPEMIESEKKKVLSYKEGDEENAQLPTNQDIKRVLDDLQWAEFVTFRSPKPTHTRSRSQNEKGTLCIKSMGRNSHPERQGRSWWRKNPIHDRGEQIN